MSFRRRYPAALRPFVPAQDGKTAWEFKFSLKDTRVTREALARYRVAEQRYAAIERQATQRASGSRQPLDDTAISFLANMFLATEIEHLNRGRRYPEQELEDLRPYRPRLDPEADWEDSRALLADDTYDVRGIVKMWGDWARAFAQSYGYLVDPTDLALTDLCLALARGSCRLWVAIDPHETFGEVEGPNRPARPSQEASGTPAAPSASLGTSRTVRELLDAYELAKGDGWSGSTKSAYVPVRRLLEDALGSREVASLTRDDARMVQGLVKRLPKNMGKRKELKGLTVQAAIEKAEVLGLPIIEPNTANGGYIVLITAIFNWAEEEQWTPKTQFYKLSVADKVDDEDRRDPFRTHHLTAIFSSAPWGLGTAQNPRMPGRYWLPLLGLFQGARRGELAGLRAVDVEEIDAKTWALLVRPIELRGLKNRASRRTLPVNPSRISLAFHEYVRMRKAAAAKEGPEALLFPDVSWKGRGQVGYNIGVWFSALIGELGLEGRKLGFHSFRHSFEDAQRRARTFGTPEGSYLSGRKSALEGSGKDYGDGWAALVADLLPDLEKVSYPGLDLSTIQRWGPQGASE